MMGELTDGEPMFAGDSDIDQLERIQRMQGRLTAAQVPPLALRTLSNGGVTGGNWRVIYDREIAN